MNKQQSRIPKFKSVQEEAMFGETHDTTEFEDEFQPVEKTVWVKSGPKKPVTVRLDADTHARLSAAAKATMTPLSTLANIWIVQRAREEATVAKKTAKPRRRRHSA